MIVWDLDLQLLAQSRGHVLQVLKLDKCSGFTTNGLWHIGRSCRNLRTLFLEESSIVEYDGNWLHELAENNTVLETLNFYMTDLIKVQFEDLELIAKNCRSLTSVKISDLEILELVGFFSHAAVLEEFSGGFFNEQSESYSVVTLPQKLCRLGLTYMGKDDITNSVPICNPSQEARSPSCLSGHRGPLHINPRVPQPGNSGDKECYWR